MMVKTPDDFAIFVRAIVPLVGDVQARLGNRFQTQEQRFASAARRQRQELVVERSVRSACGQIL